MEGCVDDEKSINGRSSGPTLSSSIKDGFDSFDETWGSIAAAAYAAAAADDAAVEGDSDEDRFSTPNGRVWTMGLLLDDGEST